MQLKAIQELIEGSDGKGGMDCSVLRRLLQDVQRDVITLNKVVSISSVKNNKLNLKIMTAFWNFLSMIFCGTNFTMV